jgi:hypothetical protein
VTIIAIVSVAPISEAAVLLLAFIVVLLLVVLWAEGVVPTLSVDGEEDA